MRANHPSSSLGAREQFWAISWRLCWRRRVGRLDPIRRGTRRLGGSRVAQGGGCAHQALQVRDPRRGTLETMDRPVSSSRFGRYVRELRVLNAGSLRAGGIPLAHIDLAHSHLDGRAGRELRLAVPLSDLRRMGAFFTGDALAGEVIRRAGEPTVWSAVVDPACGCGDLLLAAARRLAVHHDLESTLQSWGEVLHGVDCVPEFVEVARQRLMLLALLRGARPTRPDLPRLEALLPKIVSGDGRRHKYLAQADLVLLNPPYGRIIAPPHVPWASGLVTDAALWVASVIEQVPHSGRLVAVLPDVLRSGTRYARWRAEVGTAARIAELRSIGQFDALTDVDVFVLVATRSMRKPGTGWPMLATAPVTVADVCTVMVGPVVDRRDAHQGPLVPYIATQDLPQSGDFVPVRRRRFSKRLFKPPFVVLRRTSRPTSEQARLRPVIIRGTESVAVENHLLVLQPARATLHACRELAGALVEQPTTDWLNRRIRTRHLTVSAVREAPLGREATLRRAT